ncbi:MAG: hypothetical protein NT004_09610 [Bacteroidetes bacterium]|nr:hypothetical protein [Bacteroidota bacterium]
MKKTDHPFDNLFREALDEHKITPSDAARKAFLKDVADLPPARNKRRGGLIIFSALVLISIFGLVAWQFFGYNENPTSAKKPVVSASDRESANTNTPQKAKSQVNIIPDKPVPVNEIAISPNRNQIHQNKNSKTENSKPKETVINKSAQPSGTSENTDAAAIEKRGDQNYQAEFIPVAEHQVIQDMPEDKPTISNDKPDAPVAEPAKEVTPMAEIKESIADSVKASAKKSDSTKFPDVSDERSALKRKVPPGNFRASL